MNTLRSIFFGSLIRVNHLTDITHRRSPIVMVNRPIVKADDLDRMTVKQLHRILTDKKVKGRSKVTRKADLIRLIRSNLCSNK